MNPDVVSVEPVEFTGLVVLVVGVLVVAGAAAAVVLPRLVGFKPSLRRAVALIYATRLTAALGLFWLTMLVGPAPDSPAVGPGFWRGVSDAAAYHNGAVEQVAAQRYGIALREPDFFGESVAFVYAHIGHNPLPFIVLYSVVDVVTLTLLLLLSTQVLGRNPPTWFAWGLGLWPSWLGWSVQLLKDTLLLCCSTLALALAASATRTLLSGRILARCGLLWTGVLSMLAVIALLRPAVADVFSAAMGAVVVWVCVDALRGRAPWRAAVVLILLTAALPAHVLLRQALYSTSDSERLRAWSALGEAYERDHDAAKALRAYAVAQSIDPREASFAGRRLATLRRDRSTAADPDAPSTTVALGGEGLGAAAAAMPDAEVTAPSDDASRFAYSAWVRHFQNYSDRFSLENVARLRQPVGRLRVAPDAEVTTAAGLARFLPVGMAHALFGPFPWAVFSEGTGSAVLRFGSLAELVWLGLIVPLGCTGLVLACRTRTEHILIAAYVALGIVGLALGVANDGLLFRYRLPFVVPLAAFVPLGLRVLTQWRERD